MQRRRERLPEALGDLVNWPGVDISILPITTRETFRTRQDALRRYLKGEPLISIEQTAGVARQQIYRLLKRCATRHADGRIYGWRALLPHLRTVSYTRTRAVKAGGPGKFGGAAGAMNQLLERYPELEARLQRALTQHELHISASDRLIGLRRAHRQFVAHCRELGLTHRHYPLNQDQQGLRALGQAIRRLASTTFAEAAHAAGATRIGPLRPSDGCPDPVPVQRAFEAVEFDGHKLDLRLRVRVKDPRGLDHDIEIGRCWLLVVLDVATRVVLGWRLALAAEYNRYDVMQAFIHALQPKRKRKEFVIPGLRYAAGAGFADEIVPAATYAVWDVLRFDNARAHLAEDSVLMLTETLGCIADAGPVAEPNERAYIERLFGTIATNLSQRLPGSAGHSASDVRRALSDPRGKTELLVSADELDELLDVCIANYNASPHTGLGDRTPLQALAHSMAGERGLLRVLPELYQRNPHLLQPPYTCTIRGNPRRGVRPYISFYNARYSSAVLGEGTRLIGTTLQIHFDHDDVRVVFAYLPSGEELGPLAAARPWNVTRHSLRLRQLIARLHRTKQLQYQEFDDPVQAFTDYQRKRGQKKRRTAHPTLAEAQQALQEAASAPAQASEPALSTGKPASPQPLTHLGKGPILRERKRSG